MPTGKVYVAAEAAPQLSVSHVVFSLQLLVGRFFGLSLGLTQRRGSRLVHRAEGLQRLVFRRAESRRSREVHPLIRAQVSQRLYLLPRAYILSVAGSDFSFGEGLSRAAKANASLALHRIEQWVTDIRLGAM